MTDKRLTGSQWDKCKRGGADAFKGKGEEEANFKAVGRCTTNFEQCVNLGVYAKSSHRHGSLQPLPDTQNDTEHVHTREQQKDKGEKK